jgi:hypothetical protein
VSRVEGRREGLQPGRAAGGQDTFGGVTGGRQELPAGLPEAIGEVDPEAGMDAGQMMELFESGLRQTGDTEFEVAMIGAGQTRDDYRGLEGLREAMADWTSPYSDYRVFVEGVRETNSGYIFLIRQIGRTRHGGVEVENAGAAVFKGEAGSLERIEFHLDRDEAERSAADGPQSSQA